MKPSLFFPTLPCKCTFVLLFLSQLLRRQPQRYADSIELTIFPALYASCFTGYKLQYPNSINAYGISVSPSAPAR